MPTTFTIPTIFTAVDNMSPKVQNMRHSVIGFANSAEAGFHRIDRTVRGLVPGLADAQKQLLSMVGTGAALAGAFQLGSFSFNAIADYESAVDNFRVIVSELNDADFSKFQDQINAVARETKRSGTDVANTFERIAGLNAKFAETANGLGLVSEAAITLSKAAKMELGPSAENLVGIMNQFSYSAEKADKTINVLAAGQAVGAASISQTAEAFVNFGATAAGANITLEESVALVQTLGKYSLFAGEAGTQLKGSIIRLQAAGYGYKSGQFEINDALAQAKEHLDKLTTAKQKDAYITDLFGLININSGRILLNNIDTFKEFTTQVTGTSEAQKAAAINSGNLRETIKQLSAEWVNMLTTSEGVNTGISALSSSIQWLTTNLDTVVGVAVTATKVFLGYKAVMLAAQGALFLWNVTLGISSALQGASSVAMAGNTTALAAQRVALLLTKSSLIGSTIATEAATEATLGFNAVLAANPIGLVVLGVAALATGIGYLIYREKQLNEEFQKYLALKTETAIDAERKAVDALTDSYIKNGKTKKEAIALSLQQRILAVDNEIGGAEGRIRRANFVMSNNSSFSDNYQAAERERQNAQSDLLFRRESKAELEREVIRSSKAGQISGVNAYNLFQGKDLNFIDQAKVDQYKGQSSPQMQVGPDNSSQNIETVKEILNQTMTTITVKNETNAPLEVAGKNSSFSVLPGITSTLQSAK